MSIDSDRLLGRPRGHDACLPHCWLRATTVAIGIGLGAGAVGLAGCSGTQSSYNTASGSQPAPLASALRANPPPVASAAPVQPAPVRVAMVTPSVARAAPAVAEPPAGNFNAPPVSRPRGVYKVGSPYVINGQTYVPAEDPGYDKTGLGSWYGHDFHGQQTANGEIFDMNALTAAHPTLPLPSYVYVTNLRNGRTLLVRINDRGPYKPGRIIDLSRGVARALAFEGNGVTDVRVRYAGRAPLEPNDRMERQFLASQAWGRGVRPPYGLGMSVVASQR